MLSEDLPTAAALRQGFVQVAHDLGLIRASTVGASLRIDRPDYGLRLSIGDFDTLREHLASSPPPPPNAPSPQALARSLRAAALAVADMSLQVEGADQKARLSGDRAATVLQAHYAFSLVLAIAKTTRHVIQLTDDDRRRFIDLHQAGRNSNWQHLAAGIDRVVHYLLGIGYPDNGASTPPHEGDNTRRHRPRLFVSTPLTLLPQNTKEQLKKQAEAVADLAKTYGYVVVTPDPRLLGDGVAQPEEAELLAEAEQDLIAQSDIAVCLGVNIDSWGQSRTTAWVERACGAVAAIGDFPNSVSRILGASHHRTIRYDNGFTDGLSKLKTWLPANYSLAQDHADERIQIHLATVPHVTRALQALDALDPRTFDSCAVTYERARELVRYPGVLDSSSRFERRALRRMLGPSVDDLLAAGLTNRDDWRPASAAPTSRQPPHAAAVLTPLIMLDLDNAAQVAEWSEAEQLRLLRLFAAASVPGSHRAIDAKTDVNGWLDLHAANPPAGCTCRRCR